MMAAGGWAAITAAYPTINAAVNAETANAGTYIGALFANYGGETWVGDLLGLFELVWVAVYLAIAGDLAWAPIKLAFEFDRAYAASGSGLAGVEQGEADMSYLAFGGIVAFGSWISSYIMKESVTRMITFFDLQNTNDVAEF